MTIAASYAQVFKMKGLVLTNTAKTSSLVLVNWHLMLEIKDKSKQQAIVIASCL